MNLAQMLDQLTLTASAGDGFTSAGEKQLQDSMLEIFKEAGMPDDYTQVIVLGETNPQNPHMIPVTEINLWTMYGDNNYRQYAESKGWAVMFAEDADLFVLLHDGEFKASWSMSCQGAVMLFAKFQDGRELRQFGKPRRTDQSVEIEGWEMGEWREVPE